MKKIIKIIALLLLLAAGTAGYARFIEPNMLTTRHITTKAPETTSRFRIIFFTDTHFGTLYSSDNVAKIVEEINRQNPDIVLFGGDLFDNYARDRSSLDLELIQTQFRNIKAAYGKYAVFGNHDYGGGASRIYEDFMTQSEFTVLRGDSVYLDALDITIAGFDDYLLGSPTPSDYIFTDDSFHLLLSHEPVVSTQIEASGTNFLFAGHTHGGQVTIPGLTERIMPAGCGQFVKGLYSAEEIGSSSQLTMYTSSGIGTTKYPVRFMNVPEIIVLDVN